MRSVILVSVLYMVITVACSDVADTHSGIRPGNAGSAIQPTAGLELSMPSGGRAGLPPGAGAGTEFPDGTQNLFAVTSYKGNSAPALYDDAYFDNKAVESDDDGILRFTAPQYYPVNGEKLYFYAYSPVNVARYTVGSGPAVPTVEWTLTGQEDIMYARDETGIPIASVGTVQAQPFLEFHHLLKQVRFKLVQGPGFGDNISATKISVKNTSTQVTLDLITGKVTFSDVQPLSLSGDFIIQSADKATPISDCLLCEPGAELEIEVVAQNVVYQGRTTLSNANSSTVTAGGPGVSHLVTLNFTGTQILPVATIEEWKTGGVVSDVIQ